MFRLKITYQIFPLVAIFLIILGLASCNVSPESPKTSETTPTKAATILFMTDFGTIDDSVAICKGVMQTIAPNVQVIDISHQVTPYSILDGARFLAGTTPYYPTGTIFVVVIDPGVGSSRRAIVAKSKRGHYLVLPDNGLLTLVAQQDGLEAVREITNTAWMLGKAQSSTFHGRDIFSAVAGHLARGEDWTQVGASFDLNTLVKLNIATAQLSDKVLSGTVIALDGPYGNLVTNIDSTLFEQLGYKLGEAVSVKIGSTELSLPFVKTFSDVPTNQPLLYIDSRGHLALAVNLGSFAERYKVQPPVAITIAAKK